MIEEPNSNIKTDTTKVQSRRVAPYGKYEMAEMQKRFRPAMIRVLKEIEALEFNWQLTDVPFPPSLGRRDANEPIRPWSVPRQTAWILHGLALATGPKVTVEIGTSFGYSTLWLASAVEAIGGVVHTVEMMPEKIMYAEEFLSRADFNNITLHRIDATAFCNNFSQRIDFLFLDADAMSYTKYWSHLKSKMNPNSVVVADNVHTHSELISSFVEEIESSENFEVSVLPIDNGLLIARCLRGSDGENKESGNE